MFVRRTGFKMLVNMVGYLVHVVRLNGPKTEREIGAVRRP